MKKQSASEKTVVTIAVRMKSSRLPKKALLSIQGKPLIWHVYDRVSRAESVSEVVLCTSDLADDDPIAELADVYGFNCFRGHPENVLLRFKEAAARFGAKHLVRVTGDNPLSDSEAIDEMVASHLSSRADYTFTEDLPHGTRPEIISLAAIEKCLLLAEDPNQSEYMTFYFRDSGDIFRTNRFTVEGFQRKRPDYFVSVDTPEDFEVVSRIYRSLYPKNPQFTLADVNAYLDENRDILHAERYKHRKLPEGLNTRVREITI